MGREGREGMEGKEREGNEDMVPSFFGSYIRP